MNLKITDTAEIRAAVFLGKQGIVMNNPKFCDAVADLLSDRSVYVAEIERLTEQLRFSRRVAGSVRERAARAERQLQAAEQVVDVARRLEQGMYDGRRLGTPALLALATALSAYDMARQALPGAQARDLREGAATTLAGEEK